jgi:hypothetical protein
MMVTVAVLAALMGLARAAQRWREHHLAVATYHRGEQRACADEAFRRGHPCSPGIDGWRSDRDQVAAHTRAFGVASGHALAKAISHERLAEAHEALAKRPWLALWPFGGRDVSISGASIVAPRGN